MREPSRDKERLQHIVEAADVVIEHSEGLTYDNLDLNENENGNENDNENGNENQNKPSITHNL